MKSVVEGSFMTGFFYENINMERGIANLTVKEFNDLFILEEKYRPEQAAFEFLKTNCFDGVWGIAIALNCTDAVLKEISKFFLSYDDAPVSEITPCIKIDKSQVVYRIFGKRYEVTLLTSRK